MLIVDRTFPITSFVSLTYSSSAARAAPHAGPSASSSSAAAPVPASTSRLPVLTAPFAAAAAARGSGFTTEAEEGAARTAAGTGDDAALISPDLS